MIFGGTFEETCHRGEFIDPNFNLADLGIRAGAFSLNVYEFHSVNEYIPHLRIMLSTGVTGNALTRENERRDWPSLILFVGKLKIVKFPKYWPEFYSACTGMRQKLHDISPILTKSMGILILYLRGGVILPKFIIRQPRIKAFGSAWVVNIKAGVKKNLFLGAKGKFAANRAMLREVQNP